MVCCEKRNMRCQESLLQRMGLCRTGVANSWCQGQIQPQTTVLASTMFSKHLNGFRGTRTLQFSSVPTTPYCILLSTLSH